LFGDTRLTRKDLLSQKEFLMAENVDKNKNIDPYENIFIW